MTRTKARWWMLPVLWAGCFVVAGRDLVPGGLAILVTGHALLAVFALRNLRRMTGMWLVALGATCNLAVIAVNHGVPFRESSLRVAGIHANQPHSYFRSITVSHPETDADALTFLDDIIPVAPLHEVLSFGDLFLAFGAAIVLFHAMTRSTGDRRYKPRHSTRTVRPDLFLDLRGIEPFIELPTEEPEEAADEIEPEDAIAGELFWQTRAEVFGTDTNPEMPSDPDDVLFWALRQRA